MLLCFPVPLIFNQKYNFHYLKEMAPYWGLKYRLSLLISSIEHKKAIFAGKERNLAEIATLEKHKIDWKAFLVPSCIYCIPHYLMREYEVMDSTIISMLMILSFTNRSKSVMPIATLRVGNYVADVCHWINVVETQSRQDMSTVLVNYSQLFSWTNWRYSSIFQRFYTSIDD